MPWWGGKNLIVIELELNWIERLRLLNNCFANLSHQFNPVSTGASHNGGASSHYLNRVDNLNRAAARRHVASLLFCAHMPVGTFVNETEINYY